VGLPHIFIQILRPHPVRERSIGSWAWIRFRFREVEEAGCTGWRWHYMLGARG
jgi:hypothetical protein